MLFLDRTALRALGQERRSHYERAAPFPHVVIDGFLGEAQSRAIAKAFPPPSHPGWMRRDYREQAARLGQLQRTGFAGVEPVVRHFLAELCGMAFLDFLGALTGVEGLIADPHFRGAGPSITLPGGHLALHADFNRDRTRHLERKLTAIYYATDEWRDDWGGALELWDEARARCQAKYAPAPDRLVIMAHGDRYWHGHPQPLACPGERFRASIASYYYVATPSADDAQAHGALWA